MIVAILKQCNDSHLASVAFVSKSLSKSEKLHPIYERKCLVVTFGCEQFISFLEHKQFTVHTDYEVLSYLPPGPYWQMDSDLTTFKFTVVHVCESE
jgi:hypothetical protein